MNEAYAAPKSELEGDESMPRKANRLYVDLFFWSAHIGIILGIMTIPPNDAANPASALPLVLFVLGLISTFAYFFAIGIYASRLGRSSVVWGGLSFLFSPLGAWVSYIASFAVGPKTGR